LSIRTRLLLLILFATLIPALVAGMQFLESLKSAPEIIALPFIAFGIAPPPAFPSPGLHRPSSSPVIGQPCRRQARAYLLRNRCW